LRTKNYSITIGAKAIPIKKGQYQVSSRPIPVEIQEHTSLVLSKVIKKPEKCSSLPSVSGTTFSTIASTHSSAPTIQPTSITTKPHSTPISALPSYTSQPTKAHLQVIETRLDSSSARMDNLCIQLKGNTDIISHQLQQLTSHLMTMIPMLLSCYQVHSAFNWQLIITPKPSLHSTDINHSLLALSNYTLNLLNESVNTVETSITNAPKINNATAQSNLLFSHHPDLLMYTLFEIGLVIPYTLPNEDTQVSPGPAKITPQILQWNNPQNHSKQAIQACYAPLPSLAQ
jgi:hypothetical protein